MQWTESQISAALHAILNNHLSGNKTAADSRPFEIEAQQTVIASKPSQIENQKPVTISNGWWFKFKRQNSLIRFRIGDSLLV